MEIAFYYFTFDKGSEEQIHAHLLEHNIVFVFIKMKGEEKISLYIWNKENNFPVNNKITFLEFLIWFGKQKYKLQYIQSILNQKRTKTLLERFLLLCETMEGE